MTLDSPAEPAESVVAQAGTADLPGAAETGRAHERVELSDGDPAQIRAEVVRLRELASVAPDKETEKALMQEEFTLRNKLWMHPKPPGENRGHFLDYSDTGEPPLPGALEGIRYAKFSLTHPEPWNEESGIQGQVGDCYAIAGWNAIASVAPEMLSERLWQEGDTVYARTRWGVLPMNATLPVDEDGNLIFGRSPGGETAIGFYEKAAAAFMGGYKWIIGGDAGPFMSFQVGDRFTEMNSRNVATMNVEEIRDVVFNERIPVTINPDPPNRAPTRNSPREADANNFLGRHVYTRASSDGQKVRFLNPHGHNHPLEVTPETIKDMNADINYLVR